MTRKVRPDAGQPSHAVLEQAAQWYAVLRDGQAGGQAQADWQAWLRADAMHQAAWAYVDEVRRNFEPLRGQPDARVATQALGVATGRLQARRRMLAGLAALGGGALVGWTSWREALLPASIMAWGADHRTATGEQRALTLDDGSRLWLNTATAINVRFDADRRAIALVGGEVFVATAKDATRPFVVHTDHGQLRPLGTRFNVRREADHTRLAVFQGAVEIHAAGATRRVDAGQQARFGADGIFDLEAADVAREAWTQGALVADNIPLHQVVDELRRYCPGHLGVDDAVADLRVYGNFPIRDPERVLRMLASALPIRIAQPMPWWTRIEARD